MIFLSRSSPHSRKPGRRSVIRFTQSLILVLCLCDGFVWAHADNSALHTEFPQAENLFPYSIGPVDGASSDLSSAQPKRAFNLQIGERLIELRGSYFERRRDGDPTLNLHQDDTGEWGNYFEVLAKSAQLGGGLVAEGQLAYSTLGTTVPEQRPVMTRLALNGRWGKAGYGFSYSSTGSGFTFPNGARLEHARDQSELWTEYDLGLFRVRGAAGEALETHSLTRDLAVTRSAAASVYFNRAQWSAVISTTYALLGDGKDSLQNQAFSNGVTLVYRPALQLKLEPSLSFKQEWEAVTGIKSDAPAAAFSWTYAPVAEIQLSGRTAYSVEVSPEPYRSGPSLNTSAGLNWRVGKSFLGDHSVGVQFDYRSESRTSVAAGPQNNLSGMVQLRILAFCDRCY